MRLAVIVAAHRGPAQLARLLSSLQHPDIEIYLHVDLAVEVDPFRRALADAAVSNVTALTRRRTLWGGVEVVDAALDGIARGVVDDCEYFLLISGQDFPLRRADELVTFAEESVDRSYVAYWTLPTSTWRLGGRERTDFYTYTLFGRRETCYPRGEDVSFLNRRGRTLNQLLRLRGVAKPPRHFPSYVRPFGGWQWWNLNRAAADHVLQFVADHPDYRTYHEYTLLPDELFFQSILVGTGFAERHELINDSLRFTIWHEGERSPAVLRESDLDAIMASGKLFARKFDTEIDAAVVAWLAEHSAA